MGIVWRTKCDIKRKYYQVNISIYFAAEVTVEYSWTAVWLVQGHFLIIISMHFKCLLNCRTTHKFESFVYILWHVDSTYDVPFTFDPFGNLNIYYKLSGSLKVYNCVWTMMRMFGSWGGTRKKIKEVFYFYY